jgi:hypothetical protein
MRNSFKNTLYIILFALIIYLICALSKPKKNKPFIMKPQQGAETLNGNTNQNAYLNADMLTNANAQRSQKGQMSVDRLPLVEENTTIIPANEIIAMNYKDCNSEVYKDKIEKELYTTDAPLFLEKGPRDLVPIDLNDSSHRRVNFY